MKTLITVAILCSVLYAGIGAITKTANDLSRHNEKISNSLILAGGVK